MNRDFVFEDEGSEPFVLPPKSQLPGEFASYSETVANEHARRNTTSIDHKISQLRSHLYKPHESEENDVDEDEDEEENEVEGGGGRGGKFSRNGPAMAQEDGKDVKAMKTGHWEGENDDTDDDDEDEESSDIESLDDTPSVPSKTLAKIHKEDIETKAAETGSHKKGLNDFFASSEGASFSANSFVELNLSRPLLRACKSLGYQKPTPIQAACIPLALTGRDICDSAITGSGKNAGASWV